MKKQSVRLGFIALAFVFSSSALAQSEALNDLDTSKIEIPKFNHEVNLINKLNGYLPGTYINTIDGTPGAGSQIRSRGQASIYGDNDPLIILNGVPANNATYGQTLQSVAQSNRLIDINPNDITSIKWLTSAVATSLYGSRGRNGILLIETNRKRDRLTIDFNTGVWVEEVNRLPELQSTFAQGRSVGGNLTYRGPETGEGVSWGPRISDLEYDGSNDYPFDKNGRLVCAGCGNGQPANSYDNMDNFFVDGVLTQNHVSFSAPSNSNWINSFHGSIGHTYNGGVIPLSNFKRSTFNIGADFKFTQKLTSSAEMYYSNNNSSRNQTGSNASGVMLGLLRNTPTFDITNGNGAGNQAADDESSYVLSDGSQRSYRGGFSYDNPFWSVNRNTWTDQVSRFAISLRNNYDLTENISFSLISGYEVINDDRIEKISQNSAKLNIGGSEFNTRMINTSNLDFSSTFSDTNDFMGFQYTAGINVLRNDFDYQNTSIVGDEETQNVLAEKSEIVGFYGLAQHQLFDDMLEMNLSIRHEYLSQLQRFDLYYGLEGKFNFWKLLGKKNRGFISGSFGRNGGGVPFLNALSSPINSTNQYSSSIYSTTAPYSLYSSSQFANALLEPEKTDLYAVSFYSDFFDNRFSISYEYFHQDNTLIVNTPLNPTTGYTTYYSNGAQTNSNGHVLTARVNNLEFFGIQTSLFATFYSYENKVLFISDDFSNERIVLPNSSVGLQATLEEGESFGVLHGSAFERTNDGRLVVDSEGWPILDTEIRALADPKPDFLLDVGLDLKWKNFQLTGLVSILNGAQGVNYTKGILNTFGMGKDTERREREDADGYVFDGVVQNGTDSNGEPIYVQNNTPVNLFGMNTNRNFYNRYAFGGVHESNIENMDWVRLRNISLSYTLPSFTKIFNSVVVTISGKNLLLKTNYDGVDPELSGQVRNGYGINYFGNPNTKSYGINIAFGL